MCLRYSTSICVSTAKLWVLIVFVLVTLDGRQRGDRVQGVFRNSYFNWLVQNNGRYVYILANMTDKQTKSSALCHIHFYICPGLRNNSLSWGQTLQRIFSAGNISYGPYRTSISDNIGPYQQYIATKILPTPGFRPIYRYQYLDHP